MSQEHQSGDMPEISVSEPISLALGRAGLICLQPFDRRKWLTFGLAAWLAGITEFNALGLSPHLSVHGVLWAGTNLETAMEWYNGHATAVTCWTIGVGVFVCGVYLLARFLNARGQFMLFDAVVENRLEPRESWRRNRELANNLFKFRIYLDLVIFNLLLLVLVAVGAMVWQDLRPMLWGQETFVATWWTYGAAIVGAVCFVVLGLLGMMLTLLLHGMVIPVMYVRKIKGWAAFKHVITEMVLREKRASVLYLLLLLLAHSVRGMAMTVGLLVTIVVTLGIGGVLLLVPVLAILPLYGAAVLALPVEIFERSYMLYVLQQFGPEYKARRTASGAMAIEAAP